MSEPPQPGALRCSAIDERIVIEHNTSAMACGFKHCCNLIERRAQCGVVIGDGVASNTTGGTIECRLVHLPCGIRKRSDNK